MHVGFESYYHAAVYTKSYKCERVFFIYCYFVASIQFSFHLFSTQFFNTPFGINKIFSISKLRSSVQFSVRKLKLIRYAMYFPSECQKAPLRLKTSCLYVCFCGINVNIRLLVGNVILLFCYQLFFYFLFSIYFMTKKQFKCAIMNASLEE